MVPWWVIPITAWASAAITIAAYALVLAGADSDIDPGMYSEGGDSP